MIRLVRSPKPAPLTRRATAETQKLWDAWHNGAAPHANPRLYNHPVVKEALRTGQHDKCAYCETQNPSSHDVVEHYRPWDGWRQQRRDVLGKPQYFWLAYEWENLLFACDICNDQGHKGNLFPLANPAHRATAANPAHVAEDPLLINPYGPLNPEDHITWDRDVPKARNPSPYGMTTIEVFRLDRGDRRADFRRAYLQRVERGLVKAEELAPDDPDLPDVKTELLEFLDSDKPWTAMIRANLGARIRAL